MHHNFACNFEQKCTEIVVNITHQAGQPDEQHCWPVMCLVVNDNPEGQKLAGIYNSHRAAFGCRMCGYDIFSIIFA